jgi:CRISPR-associated helicase Cas3/CRISPR-associated endonuclease Cas3-HD
MLSDAARAVWAKSNFRRGEDRVPDPAADEPSTRWLPLWQHLADTADVAERLWDQWVPRTLSERLVSSVGDEATARTLVAFLAGAHDVGKASPAFAVQVESLAAPMVSLGLDIPPEIAGTPERRMVRHEIVSFLALRDWLVARHGMERSRAQVLASIVGAHHGIAHGSALLGYAQDRPHLSGGGLWTNVRNELLDWVAERTGFGSVVKALNGIRLPQSETVLLSSLVIMADWIASNEDAFPLFGIDETPAIATDDTGTGAERAEHGWRQTALPGRWQVAPPPDAERHFTERFGFAPNSVQREFLAVASRLTRPGVLILEAPMGVGKTEAALAAAEVLAARFGASGVFVGLPTQATSDSIFHRVLNWAGALPAGLSTVFLAHSRTDQNLDYERLLERSRYRTLAMDDDMSTTTRTGATGHEVLAAQWFTDRRRGPLADLVVGTIDQLLFLALRSRYVALRHLAFAGKIVIVDEAHAYSTYMNAFLERALHWLGAHGATVVILSATLPTGRRARLVAAYEAGRRNTTGFTGAADSDTGFAPSDLDQDLGYPAIVASGTDAGILVANPPIDRDAVTVRLERLADTDDALVELVRDALTDGGCVAVIRNTVDRARETASALAAAFPDVDVRVAHARFLATDRAKSDLDLLRRFGRPAPETRRPERCILVATQVVEQSLDLDFDLIVSELAPVDLLLQRMGRLHRHSRTRPKPLERPRFIIAGVDWSADPPLPDRVYQKIYSPYLLLRTLAVLADRDTITLPDDIAPLVQAVYSDSELGRWTDELADLRVGFEAEAQSKGERACPFLIGTVAAPGASLVRWNDLDAAGTERAGRAAVRDSDETLEVIALWKDKSGVVVTPPWLDRGGTPIPLDAPPSGALTRVIRGCLLRLPSALCRGDEIDAHIAELERRRTELGLQSWFAVPLLRDELVLAFDSDDTATLGRYRMHYDELTGLAVVKTEGGDATEPGGEGD